MALLNKIYKTSKIAASRIKETARVRALENKIAALEKKSCDLIDESKKSILIDREILLRKADSIKEKEKGDREVLKQELKKAVAQSREERRIERERLKPFEKIKREFRELPIVTLVDDLAEGAAGMDKINDLIAKDENNPYNWLILAEAMKFYNKTFLILNGIKAPIDMIGSAIDVSIQYLGEYFEAVTDKDKWTYERALAKAAFICRNTKLQDSHTLIILGRCEQLLGMEIKDQDKKLSYLEASENSYQNALVKGCTIHQKGEVYYYLAGLWEKRDKKRFVNYLNQSINYGFVPAENAIRDFLKKNRITTFKYDKSISKGMVRINEFKYSYKRNTLNVAISGVNNMLKKQAVKITKTSEKFFDNIANRLLK